MGREQGSQHKKHSELTRLTRYKLIWMMRDAETANVTFTEHCAATWGITVEYAKKWYGFSYDDTAQIDCFTVIDHKKYLLWLLRWGHL